MSTPSTPQEAPDLWSFAWGQPQVDPERLAIAIEAELQRDDQDFRTRVLIRDASEGLEKHWGHDAWSAWIESSPALRRIHELRREDLGKKGFRFDPEHLVKAIEPESVREYFRELGGSLARPATIRVGGAIPLILGDYLSRGTHDIDVVDEIPEEIRGQHRLLRELDARYRLMLTHFQSHYLPDGWESRLHSVGLFRNLQVFTVDPADIFLGKLFSRRAKDLDDLRALKVRFDKTILIDRLRSTASRFLADQSLRTFAEGNWYVLYGEPLPDGSGPPSGQDVGSEEPQS